MSGEALTVHPADPLDRIDGMEEAEIADRIDAIRTSMGSNLLILGHHYQRDSIIRHADLTGDSFQLEMALKADAKHMCSVVSISWQNPTSHSTINPSRLNLRWVLHGRHGGCRGRARGGWISSNT